MLLLGFCHGSVTHEFSSRPKKPGLILGVANHSLDADGLIDGSAASPMITKKVEFMMLNVFAEKEMKMKAHVMLFTRDNNGCSTPLPGQYPKNTDLTRFKRLQEEMRLMFKGAASKR